MPSQSEHIPAFSKNYYLVMGIHPSASAQEISRAFKKLALKWHPDRHDTYQKSFAHRKFIDLLEAYEVLGNPRRRIRYDAYRDYRNAFQAAAPTDTGDGAARQAHSTQGSQAVEVILGVSRKFENELQQWCKKANRRARHLAEKSYLHFVISVDIFSKLVVQGIYNTLDIIAGKAQNKKGMRDCQKRIEQAPDDGSAHFRMGFLLHQNRNYDKAAEYYLTSLRLSPQNADILCNLGRLREEQNQYDRAVRCYKRAVELNPNLHVVYAYLGILHLKMKQYGPAKECMDFLIGIGRLDLSSQIERAFISLRS